MRCYEPICAFDNDACTFTEHTMRAAFIYVVLVFLILCDERSSAVRAQVRFGDVWVSSYDIEWTPTSYPSRRPKDTAELPFPNQSQSNQVNYSYSLIELNTHKLKRLRHDPWMGVYRGVP